MRLKQGRGAFDGVGIAFAVFFSVVACGVAPEVVAEDLVQALSSIWDPATALGLTLMTIAGRDRPKY